MKTAVRLLFYISGFGFGHMTRSIALIEGLLEQEQDLEITIKCNPAHRSFVAGYLQRYFPWITIEPFSSGFSIVFNEEKWEIDILGTVQGVEDWIGELAQVVEQEVTQVSKKYDLVISDIVPEAFAVARRLKIPSIGISNFTWYEICRGFVSEEKLQPLRALYEQAEVLFEYGLSTENELPMEKRIPVGLVSRPMDAEKISVIQKKYKKQDRLLLFLSIGGALTLNHISLCPDVDYLCTQGITLPPLPNVYKIPPDTLDTQNYLAACDGVITKCGWSTVTESLIAQKPLYILKSKNGWVEEKYILAALRKLGVVREIEAHELMDISCTLFLEGVKNKEKYNIYPEFYQNNRDKLVEMVMDYIIDKV